MTRTLRQFSKQLFLFIAILAWTTCSRSSGKDLESITALRQTAIDGRPIEWDSTSAMHVFCFLGVECPVARLYATRIQSTANEFESRGVRFIGVDRNSHDSQADLRQFAEDLKVTIPLVQDSGQSIARYLNATRTAEVVVVDPSGTIQYRGRIDDQYSTGVTRGSATTNELKQAIEEILSGRFVSVPTTRPVGCLITFARSEQLETPVTFTKTAAPILYRHCLECHRPGEIGPFDISNYNEVRGWAEMIVEVIDQKRMPPWHASSDHGEFKNARKMSDEEIQQIRKWVSAGAPFGEADELPEIPTARHGWRMDREPDKIVAMREAPYRVPANGSVEYQYFVVDPEIKEDRWVSAAQVIPGNAGIVHHAIVFIRPPDDREFNGIGWLTAYVPGQRATQFPVGYARRVPAGSKLVFQMHYTPNGREQTDLTRIGMNFVDDAAVTNEVFTLVGIDQEFEIPPGVSDHIVHARLPWITRDGELIAIMPHMHLRGKSFELRSKSDNAESVLLHVPNYDFNWQHTYELTKPLELRDVNELEFLATFDNSSDNPFNPNPNEYVMWGDQTWQEMAVAFFEVARPRGQLAKMETSNVGASELAKMIDEPPSQKQILFAEDFLKRFDSNQDAMISFSEASRIVQDYSFHRIDKDGDRMLTRDELMAAAKGRRAR